MRYYRRVFLVPYTDPLLLFRNSILALFRSTRLVPSLLFQATVLTDHYNRTSPVYHPLGNFVWKFHRSRHILSRSLSATKPNSFSAIDGSAVRSGTSPSLYCISRGPVVSEWIKRSSGGVV